MTRRRDSSPGRTRPNVPTCLNAPTRDFGQNSLASRQLDMSLVIVHVLLHPHSAKLFATTLAHARVVASATALGFAAALESEPVDVAVVDPSVAIAEATPRIGGHPVVRALSSASAPPFVLYLSAGRAELSLRAALMTLGPAMVAARGIDDHPDRIRAIIQQAIASRTPEDLLMQLTSELSRLRPCVREAIANAVRSPLEFDSVEALAQAAGVSTRALSREFKSAGIALAANVVDGRSSRARTLGAERPGPQGPPARDIDGLRE